MGTPDIAAQSSVAEVSTQSRPTDAWTPAGHWRRSHRFDPRALPLADRHYNRQKPGTPQFVPPASCVVLLTPEADALWVMTRPEFSDHAWPGAWMNTLFRNEGGHRSSELILQAIAAVRGIWGDPPAPGCVTFVDATKVRRKRDPGRCYRRAGFRHVGFTKTNHLWVFQLLPDAMPPPTFLEHSQRELF